MQAANRRKTIGLLMGMGALMWVVVYAAMTYFGGTGAGIVPIAVGISLISVWGAYYGSDKLVLTMTGAKLIQESDNPKLFDLIQEITIASGLPMPKVAVVIDDAPNAFATGRNPEHALIAFTTGILDVMDRDQLQGVIAHELAHVANRDTLVSAVAATTAGAIAIVSDVLARMMFFGGRRDNNNNANPIALLLSLTRNPAGLRSALEVLAADSTVVQQRSTAVAHIWIESPLDAKSVSKMFSTHPPIQERIAVLKSMESLG
jgi:heat shock protein HtpX